MHKWHPFALLLSKYSIYSLCTEILLIYQYILAALNITKSFLYNVYSEKTEPMNYLMKMLCKHEKVFIYVGYLKHLNIQFLLIMKAVENKVESKHAS